MDNLENHKQDCTYTQGRYMGKINIPCNCKENLLKRLVLGKILIMRSMQWLSLINSGMVLFIALAQAQSRGILTSIPLKGLFPLVYLLGIGCLLLIGFLDRRYLHKQENRYLWDRNPDFIELLDKVDRIETMVKRGDTRGDHANI